MTEAKHTPGPTWEIKRYDNCPEILKEAGPRGRFLFTIEERPGLGPEAARIRTTLTAAPDLLAALIALMPSNLGALPETMPDSAKLSLEVSFGELRKARAAIAKAEGR